MDFDPRSILANLVEKEKFRGHHSAEGRAIRNLGRAIHGWSTGNLSPLDVLVLCDQSIEDWLKVRLALPAWSAPSLPKLLKQALDKKLLMRSDVTRLRELRTLRSRVDKRQGKVDLREAEAAVGFCIQLIEKHW
jgi:hypothetical protein